MVIFVDEVHQPKDQIAEQQAFGLQHIGQGLINLIEAY
jgi:replication-associated recombination protein RarA